jgi:DNA-binding transcriptional ArsR family regulator
MDALSAMSAAGHPDRARILEALREERSARGCGLSISEVAARCELDRFATSRHLALLRSCGLVADERNGYRRVHHLRNETFEAIEDWAFQFSEPPESRR